MRVSTLVLTFASLFFTQTVAATTPCLSDADANTVADNFGQLLSNYSNASADAFLTKDFVDYSDSVIELINQGCPNSPIPLGTPVFTSRDAFKAGQGSQPNIPFQKLNVWHNCNTVTLRWKSAMSPGQVTGLILFETVYQDKRWLIKTVYSEFNSGAWLVNIGTFKPANCKA